MKRHQELTGGLGQWLPGAKSRPGRRRLAGTQASEPCHYPAHWPDNDESNHAAARQYRDCCKCGVAPAGPGGVLCEPCLERIKTATPWLNIPLSPDAAVRQIS
jgi:hypothetical protein